MLTRRDERQLKTLTAPCLAALVALVACATATTEDIEPGNGNEAGASGASTTGGKGGASSGGSGATSFGGTGAGTTGGAIGTGGASTGGASTGGASAGGASTGGASTGGASTGGASTGGMSPFGGASTTGGTTTGGATTGGTAGAGARAGAGGMAGAAGASGAGGSSVVVPPTGECAMNPTLALSYKVNQTGDAVGFDLKLTNSGAAPISASEIEFQYYISQEESAWQERVLDVYAVQGSTYTDMKTTGTVTVDPLTPALGAQTHVVRIRQTASAMLPPGTTSYLQLTVRLQPNPASPNQTQTNDFSYDATHTALAAWDHVAVFVGGVLAFGCTPEA